MTKDQTQMKWHPSTGQWAVIWSAFVSVAVLSLWDNESRWLFRQIGVGAAGTRSAWWLVLLGGALWVWKLEGTKR